MVSTKLICFFIFTLVTIQVWSSTNKTPKKETNKFFKTVDKISKPNAGFLPINAKCQTCSNPSDTEEDENDLLQKCAIDFCGPANENLTKSRMNDTVFDTASLDPEILNEFDREIRPILEQLINQEIAYKKSLLKALREQNINMEQLNEHEMREFEDIFQRAVNQYTTFSKETRIFSLRDSPPASMQKGLESYIRSKNWEMRHPIEHRVKRKDTDIEEIKNFLKQKHQEVSEYYELESLLTREEQKKLALLYQGIQNSSDSDSLLEIARSLDAFPEFHNANKKDSKISRYDNFVSCLDYVEACKQTVYGELFSLKQPFQDEIKRTEAMKERKIRRCKSFYGSVRIIGEATNQYRSNLPQYKIQFLNRAFLNYSDISKRSFEEYMNQDLFFRLPSHRYNTTEDFKKDMLQKLRNLNQWEKDANADYVPIMETADSMKRITDRMLISNDYYKYCSFPDRDFTFSSDQFDSDRSRIDISLFSCSHGEFGKQTLAHEMGHALSHRFLSGQMSKISYKKYRELRECAKKQYKVGNIPASDYQKLKHKNDQYYTEEDAADLIAYWTFQNDPVLFSCNMLDPVWNGASEYKDLQIMPQKYYIRENIDINRHSSDLLRVLREAIHKRKKIPLSCRQIMDKYKDRINFEPCF